MLTGVDDESAVPPVAKRYHFIDTPVAVRLATVGLSATQKFCVAEPVGAGGSLTITTTAARILDSHPPTDVWLA